MKALSGNVPEVVTFGETMALFRLRRHKGPGICADGNEIVRGAESNVAIGLARLGHRAGWCGRLGRDPLGRHIVKALRGEGVDVSRVEMAPDAPTGLMMRELIAGKSSVYYYRAGSAASRMTPGHLDKDYIRSARLLHVTGITCALSDSCAETVYEAVAIAKAAGVKVSFDPNLRLKLWTIEAAREKLLPLARQADYFLPGLDELKLLYGTEDEQGIFRCLSELPGVSIVKGTGQELCSAGQSDRQGPVRVGGACRRYGRRRRCLLCRIPVRHAAGADAVEAVRLGNITGAMVVQAFGDWEALPTAEQLQAVLNQAVHIER